MERETYQHILLNHLDDPMRLLIFTMDQVLTFMFFFIFSIFIKKIAIGLILGGVGAYLVGKFRKKIPKGIVSHLAYWYLPSNKKKGEFFIPSHIREWVG